MTLPTDDDFYIALAMLHGPSTFGDIGARGVYGSDGPADRGNHDPLHNDSKHGWWVFRNAIAQANFDTAGEAAKYYCEHYGLLPTEATNGTTEEATREVPEGPTEAAQG
jgi:hypothetical protein